MTRRIKRLPDFEISLQIKNQDFIRPPREAQRNWLLNSALGEFADNLNELNNLATDFVAGSENLLTNDRSQANLSDQEIMEDWQIPLMRKLVSLVTENHGDLLEIGFGRGIASEFIQQQGVNTHTIIECNDTIVTRFERWRNGFPGRDIRMIQGLWQDVLEGLGQFDAVFFHTYPLNETDFVDQIGGSVTFAEHFFSHAAAHLRSGGAFTYLSNEMDSLSRGHQRALLRYFSSISFSVFHDLEIPPQVKDSWWAKSMVVIKAIK